MNSKQKGKRGELEFCKELRKYGVEAKRGVQYHGRPGSPDVITDIPLIHFEVKRNESIGLGTKLLKDAWDQADGDAGEDTIPVVVWRNSHRPWMVSWKPWIDEYDDYLLATATFEDWMKSRGYTKG